MQSDLTRRRLLAAAVAAGVIGISATNADDLLEQFAPLSGGVWSAADRSRPTELGNPYGEARVTIDDDGVPHVESQDEHAATYAVGYQHGYDRLFQLDLQRRLMRGELSAVVGELTLESDEFHVRMDFLEAARASWELLSDTHVGSLIEAYADGVNAARADNPLPIEFELLEFEPDPWTPVDTLLMEKQISWSLTGNFRALRRAVASDQLEADIYEALFPERMDHDVPILRIDHAEADRLGTVRGVDGDSSSEVDTDTDSVGSRTALASWLHAFETPPGYGSNSWVLSGDHTASGRPILANDPHLELLTPPLWYEQHVRVPEYAVRGVTFPGVPFVVIGASEHATWGVTNVGADVLDCYTYKIDDDEERYQYDGGWQAFEIDEHEIEVADGENRTITTRKTVHGPLLEQEGERVGVAWTGLTATRTAQAVYELGLSETVDDALEAARQFDTPTQNLLFASSDGGTCYVVTGKLPIRETDGAVVDGDRVFDGSNGEGEWSGFTPYGHSSWDGFVPFEEKPQAIDPEALATANQRVADDPDHYIGAAYAMPYRGQRIYDELDGLLDGETTIESHLALQTDTRDERADDLLPLLLEAIDSHPEDSASEDDGFRNARETLEAWNHHMDRDEAGALVFARWLEHYRAAVFEPHFEATDLDTSYYPNDWILATLPPESPVFDHTDRETAMIDALEATLEELSEADLETYGDWNTTEPITHPFGDEAPFLNYDVRPLDGSRATVNNYRFESAVGASWRMVVEAGGDGRGIVPGGNSGDRFSPHYSDQFEAWSRGEYKSMERRVNGDRVMRFSEGLDD